ncbi:uncharacterized protein [Antedon mediterranea]|uniref:uncharacterized protein n=1 Tax=Antedon mediterranea TaxID=105859 RepID=UPI003AF6B278
MNKARTRPTVKTTRRPAIRRQKASSSPPEIDFSGRMITPSLSDDNLDPIIPTMESTTIPTFEQSLLGTQPVPLNAKRSRIEDELGDITTRLNQTLTEFEKYNNEPERIENVTIDDVTSYVNGMPSGPIKFQLKQLLSNYTEMCLKIGSENTNETDEIMASLAEWFMDEMVMDDICSPDDLISNLQESMTSTKMGFEKLKMLNRKILSSKVQNIDQVKSHKIALQQKVVSKFKSIFNNKKIKDIKANRTVHWKYASNEIVSLLKKVRIEGVSNIGILEEKLEQVIHILEDQTKTVSQMQSKLKDKDDVIDEMERKQSGMDGEIMLLVDEKEKLKNRVRSLIKKLKAVRAGNAMTHYENEAPLDEESHAYVRYDGSESEHIQYQQVYASDNFDARISCDESTTNNMTFYDIDDPSKMIDALTDKILSLEKQIIQKEMRIMKIENNYQELAEVVKTSSPNVVANLPFDLDTHEYKSKLNTKSICKDCNCVTKEKGSTQVQKIKLAKEQEKIAKFEQDNTALRAELARVRAELDGNRAQLAKTKWELITLRYVDNKSTRLPRPFPGNNEEENAEVDKQEDKMYEMKTDETSKRDSKKRKITFKSVVKKIVAPVQMQARTPNKLFITQQRNATFKDEFEAYASVLKQVEQPVKQITMSRIKQQSNDPNAGGAVEVEQVNLAHQGVQTDPAMDPLGAWSNGIEVVNDDVNKMSSRLSVKLPLKTHNLPAPPTEWENFDPTPDIADTEMHTSHLESFPDPDQLRNNNDVIAFVERELERMVQGIIGFTEYLNSVIEKETDSLNNVNKKLRTALSERTIMAIEQKLNKSQEKEDGCASRGSRSKTPTMIGRFELATNAKPSKYVHNKYFASYSFGKRKVDDPTHPPPIDSKRYASPFTPPPPWYNIAETHIQASEAKARSQRNSIDAVDLGLSDQLKKQVTMIGEHAIRVLRGTSLIFQESFEEQIKEYSQLHDACSNKIPEWKKNIAASLRQGRLSDGGLNINPLVIKRSSSERRIDESKERHREKENERNGRTLCVLRSTQSLSSLENSHRYLPSLMVHKNLDNMNRPEMKIPKAVVPRKGTIMLHTNQLQKEETKLSYKGYDEKKRFKPVPVSHKKLLAKQKDMLGRVYKPKSVPEQDFTNGPRTVLELSQQIVEFKPKNTRELPPLPAKQVIEKAQRMLVTDNTTAKDKLLMHS